ncbi:MAG: hypothetical protein COA78_32475 [Blastopirellula sp.]|nr:MAG: hypothetical protein COA78_32475 [Blastopirellula sp.]
MSSLNLYIVIAVVDSHPYYTFVVDENPDEVSSRVRRLIPQHASISNIIYLCKADDSDLDNIHLIPSGEELRFDHFNKNIVAVISTLATIMCRLRSITCCVNSLVADLGFKKYAYLVTLSDGTEVNHSVHQKSLESAYLLADDFVIDTYGKLAIISKLQPIK